MLIELLPGNGLIKSVTILLLKTEILALLPFTCHVVSHPAVKVLCSFKSWGPLFGRVDVFP
jgi:hypothetical protein